MIKRIAAYYNSLFLLILKDFAFGKIAVNKLLPELLSFEDNQVDYCYDLDPYFNLGAISCDRTSLSDPWVLDKWISGLQWWNNGVLEYLPGIMTCHEAVNVENNIQWELLNYPYCNYKWNNTEKTL